MRLGPSAAGRSPAWKILPLLAALILILSVALHFCLWKSGMFIDEIYTFGLANSHYMPFIGSGADDRLDEQRITRDDFFDYLAVTGEEDRFDFGSVYWNQEHDVHPPLHYWVINLASSLAPGSFSKWIGLIPDLLIYLGTLVLLFVLSLELTENRAASVLTVLLYGLSRVGLSTVLMIRMYVLLGFWTVLLALLVLRELRRPSLKYELAIGLTLFLGLLTQYYFVFYAFFLCLFSGIALLCRRLWKPALRFGVCAFAGVGLMLLAFPAALSHLTDGGNAAVSGSNALAQLLQVWEWPGRLRYYFGQIRHGLPAAVLCAAVALGFSAVCILAGRRAESVRRGSFQELLLLLLPVLPTVFIAAVLSPVVEGRYIYNIMPVCALFSGWCLALALRFCGESRSRHVLHALFLCLPVCVSAFFAFRTVPDYIYDEHRSFDALIAEHAEAPCLYMTGYFAPVTQDMLQLMQFEDVYVTERPDSEGLLNYLAEKKADECVVFIDVSPDWGSGFRPEEVLDELMDETDYVSSEPLYAYALSTVWLLKK